MTVDQLLSDEADSGGGTQVRWALTDHQGSVRDLASNAGAILKHREFDSFGRITSDSAPTVDLLFGYTGQEWDATVELAYYSDGGGSGRWYDPGVGRFLSEDPIRDDRQNLYRYVGNNAVNATDPSGLTKNNLGGKPAATPQQVQSFNNIQAGIVQGAQAIGNLVATLANAGANNRNATPQQRQTLTTIAHVAQAAVNIGNVLTSGGRPPLQNAGAMIGQAVSSGTRNFTQVVTQAARPIVNTAAQTFSRPYTPPARVSSPPPVSIAFGGGMFGFAPVIVPNIAAQATTANLPQGSGPGSTIISSSNIASGEATLSLGPLFHCATCHAPANDSTGERQYIYYRCTRYTSPGHPRTRTTEQELDRQILELFDHIKIQDPAVRDWFVDVLKAKTHDDGQASLERRQELQRQLTRAMNQQQRLVDLRLDDESDEQTFADKRLDLADRISELKLNLEALDRGREEMTDLALKVFELSQTLRDKWLTAEPDVRR
ncbi:MAG: hypothetical protein KF708_24880 [Pirellulales bacterium]|nr:hypothetical protein [Pirellulales bacterium]